MVIGGDVHLKNDDFRLKRSFLLENLKGRRVVMSINDKLKYFNSFNASMICPPIGQIKLLLHHKPTIHSKSSTRSCIASQSCICPISNSISMIIWSSIMIKMTAFDMLIICTLQQHQQQLLHKRFANYHHIYQLLYYYSIITPPSCCRQLILENMKMPI